MILGGLALVGGAVMFLLTIGLVVTNPAAGAGAIGLVVGVGVLVRAAARAQARQHARDVARLLAERDDAA